MSLDNEIGDDDLPIVVDSGKERPSATRSIATRLLSRVIYIPLIFLLIFAGGVVGLYFQPPAVQWFYETTGLQPGAGSASPIAIAPEVAAAVEEQNLALAPSDIVALGKLLPVNDVITVSPPFGANDAAVASIEVRNGQTVLAGDLIAILDNRATLEGELQSARAALAVREANLIQTRELTQSLRSEAEANLERALADARNAIEQLTRSQTLFERGIVTQANLDNAQTEMARAEREVDRARSVFQRYESESIDNQADVIVAMRNLEAAAADLERAEQNLERAFVRAPSAGTVLDINVGPGEKPGTDGIAVMGDLGQMKAELEVYQTEIGSVEIGQPVEMTALALPEALLGTVSEIGLRVGRQTILEDDPVANTDARVITVAVLLDDPSSAIAARFTDLEIVGRIDTDSASR